MATNKASANGYQNLHAFFQGAVVPMEEAKVSVMTHALHYGTAVFEGIRGNWNEEQGKVFIFRMREHYERLIRGCKILLLDIPYFVFADVLPTFEALNAMLATGIRDAGMSGGIEWKPFQISPEEYREVVEELRTNPRMTKLRSEEGAG